MKAILATLLVATGPIGAAYAQPAPVQIDDLRAPTSPAFVLLEVAPSAIERPENPKSFTLNLINTVSRSRGLPQNYALEVAPYWLTFHPDLTFAEYQSPGVRSLVQTLAFSVATTPMTPPEDPPADAIGTRLGIGVRTNILSGRFHPRVNELVSELAAAQGRFLDTLEPVGKAEEAVKQAEEALAAARKAGQKTDAAEQDLKARQADLLERQQEQDAVEASARSIALEIQAMDAQRLGLIVALAAAAAWDFPQDDFNRRQPGRWGVWVTPTYRFTACTAASAACTAVLDAMAVVRALQEPDEDASFDVGGRVLWQPTRELKVSAELLRRRAGASATAPATSSNRTSGMLEYQLRDGLSIYGSFGRDFQKQTGQRPLVSLMGLNVGLGRTPTVLPISDQP